MDAIVEAGLASFTHRMGGPDKLHLPESVGGGAAWLDYDGDGDLDAYLTNGSSFEGYPPGGEPRDALFRNEGDGTFRDVTAEAGLGDTGWTCGVAVGDYDNDGRPDIYLTNFGPNVLYHNEGDGTFRNVTARAGVGDRRWSTGAAFFDYDGDGDLDLYVPNYVEFDRDFVPANREFGEYRGVRVAYGPRGLEGARDTLYRNEGNGTFTDVTEDAGLAGATGYGFQALAFDMDGDGDTDLFVGNDSMANYLYRNDGGKLTERGFESGVGLSEGGIPQASMGAAVGDYNSDGRLDLYLTHFSEDYNTLYRNDGEGFFTDVTFPAGLARGTYFSLGWGCALFDADNDGDLDVFAANGHIYPQVDRFDFGTSYRQKNRLFENNGDGTFREVTDSAGPGLRLLKGSRGAAFGDYDDDGDVDVLVNNLDDHPTLLRNETPRRGHWIGLRLVGTRSNRDAVGAVVAVKAAGRTRIAPVVSGTSYLSANDPRLHVGLGEADRVERLEVRWPGGATEVLEGVAADRTYTIEEGKGIVRTVPPRGGP